MSTRRLSIVLLTLAAATLTTNRPATACRLTDWLCGRSAPYVVNYAPAPQASGFAPYAAGYAPVASPYVAGYSGPAVSVINSGAYQLQRPAYYDNPSVYTGRPVVMAPGNVQASYFRPQITATVPLSTTLRGAPSTLRGAPSTLYRSAYPTTAAAGTPLIGATPVGTPDTAIPATPVAPLYPVAVQPRRGGLSRFFGSLLGTNYQTTYYRAPVTYYRPATSVDPVTGAAVTVQQPCTSYVQQLQRTPLRTTVQAAPTMPQSPSMAYPSNTYIPSTSLPAASGIGQVGAITSPSDYNVVPIPSTGSSLPPSYYQQPSFPSGAAQPNTAPLTGAPPSSGGDMAPMEPPQLNSARPAESPTPAIDYGQTPPSAHWKLQEAEDSTAMNPPKQLADPASLSPPANTGLRPIPAADDYQSPFVRRPFGQPAIDVPSTAPATGLPLVAPPLPPSSWDASDANSASYRRSIPVREAALIRKSPVRRSATHTTVTGKPSTESGWYAVKP